MSSTSTGSKRSRARDELPSRFYPILEALVGDIPGAVAAIFCDDEGESIEFFGDMDPYLIKVAGAYGALIYPRLGTSRDDPPRLAVISCRNLSVCIHGIERYTLVVILERRAFAAVLERALISAAEKFLDEAGIGGRKRPRKESS